MANMPKRFTATLQKGSEGLEWIIARSPFDPHTVDTDAATARAFCAHRRKSKLTFVRSVSESCIPKATVTSDD